MKAILALEDGSYFEGESFGAERMGLDQAVGGEVCFNTSMTGYQEILTDPSYAGQIVTMTYPEIGNYGINPEDVESRRIQVSALVVKNCCEYPSNWRAGRDGEVSSVSQYLRKQGIPGLKGIDTRRLVRILREKGAQNGIIVTGEYDLAAVLAKAKGVPSLSSTDYVKQVTITGPEGWNEREHPLDFRTLPADSATQPFTVVAIDYGIKNNILRKLRTLGMKVVRLPAQAKAEDVLAAQPDGIFLSNGPGDPANLDYAVDTIRGLLGVKPIFGICLGHQLLARALGGETFKLKFGHRGANHPVKDLRTGKVEITSQNHGFAVSPDSLDASQVEITHLNLNDQTVAGLRHRKFPAYSVQYHPEASPGPKDSHYLFEEFLAEVKRHAAVPTAAAR